LFFKIKLILLIIALLERLMFKKPGPAISISEKLLIFSKNTFLNFSASIFGS